MKTRRPLPGYRRPAWGAGVARSGTSEEGGFTLIELVIALAIMSVVLLGVYTTLFSVTNARDRVSEDLNSMREVRRFMDIFTTEVRSAYFNTDDPVTQFTAGLSGTGQRLTSSVAFTSHAGQVSVSSLRRSDLQTVSYFVEETEDGEAINLYKEVRSPYMEESRATIKAEVLEDISGFDLSFYTGGAWVQSFDASVEKGPPEAVRVVVTLTEAGIDREYSSIARVMVR